MPRFDGPADERDEFAADRDDTAGLRDFGSSGRATPPPTVETPKPFAATSRPTIAEPPGDDHTLTETSPARPDELHRDRAARVLAESRERLIDSRACLTRSRSDLDIGSPATPTDDESTEQEQP